MFLFRFLPFTGPTSCLFVVCHYDPSSTKHPNQVCHLLSPFAAFPHVFLLSSLPPAHLLLFLHHRPVLSPPFPALLVVCPNFLFALVLTLSSGPSSSSCAFDDLLSDIKFLESHFFGWQCLPGDSLNSASSFSPQCDAILSHHGIAPSSIRLFLFLSHLLHGDCFRSESQCPPTCVALASCFNCNVQLFLGKLYDFLVSSDLSFAFLCEIALILGLPHHLLQEFRSPSNLCFFIDYFRDGFASYTDLPEVLCSIHDQS